MGRFTGRWKRGGVGSLAAFALAGAVASFAAPPASNPVADGIARLRKACEDVIETAPAPAPGQDLSAELARLVLARRPADAEALLSETARVPSLSPFNPTFMLMGASESLQAPAADADHPRIIAYQRNVALGLTGHPDPALRAHNARIEQFRYDLGRDEWQPVLIGLASSPPAVDESPRQCAACHGSPLRPLWRSYRIWPGAYRAFIDYFTPQENNGRKFAGRPGFVKDGPLFVRQLAGPYRWLEPKLLDPGERLNHFLNRLNFRRIARQLRESPDFASYEVATVAALLGCEDVPSFLGPPGTALRARHEATGPRPIPGLEREVREHLLRLYAGIEAQNALTYNELSSYEEDEFDRRRNELHDARRVAALRYLFESRGIDLRGWSLSRDPGPDTYGWGFHEFEGDQGGLWRLACAFIPGLVERDRRLAGLLAYNPEFAEAGAHPERPLCQALRRAAPAR